MMKPIDKHDPFDRPHLREDYVNHNFCSIIESETGYSNTAAVRRHREKVRADRHRTLNRKGR